MKKIVYFIIPLCFIFSSSIHAQTIMTCAEADSLAQTLSVGGITSYDIYVEGYVTQTVGGVSRGQQRFYIDDNFGSGKKTIQAYYANIPDPNNPVNVGDRVSLTGPLTNYNYTAEMKNAAVIILDRYTTADTISISVCDAISIGQTLPIDQESVEYYSIVGVVSRAFAPDKTYGDQSFHLLCDESEVIFEGHNTTFVGDAFASVGDTVLVVGHLYNYQGSKIEINRGKAEVIGFASSVPDSNCVITYTASSKIPETYLHEGGLYTGYFNQNVIRHTFSDGVGTIIFDAPVTNIGNDAFNSCKKLTSISIPNSVTDIAIGAFEYCDSLQTIIIPNSVTSVGSYAFAYCDMLNDVTLSSSLTSLHDGVFRGCSSLTTISIPASVVDLEYGVFSDCSKLSSIVVDSLNPVYDSRDNCNAVIETSTNKLIMTSRYAFVIPSSVAIIGKGAFYQNRVDSIFIPEGVTTIEDYAFMDCPRLRYVSIPQSASSIGVNFASCDLLNRIEVDSQNHFYDSRNNCNSIIESATNLLKCGCGYSTIPEGVTSIGYRAFSRFYNLRSLTLPSSLASIQAGAFYECQNLKKIYNYSPLNLVLGDTTNGCVALYASRIYLPCVLTFISEYDNGEVIVWSIDGDTIPSGFTAMGESQFIFSATPREGYQFNGWSDGVQENPRLLTLTNDTSIFANFGTKMCSLTLLSNIDEAADVFGAGVYAYGTSVTCSFDLMSGYEFVKWSDGKTFNPYKFKIYDDMTLCAFFAEESAIPAPDSVIVTPSDSTAGIQWPQVDNASSYTLTITKQGEVICTLSFNALGQLVNIDFSASPRRSPQALSQVGFNFTITGLQPGTTYSYTIKALDNTGEELSTETGEFTTTGDHSETGITSSISLSFPTNKFLLNGVLYIQRGDMKFNATGMRVQ